MQAQPDNHLTDLDRQRLIFHRIYQRALDLGTAAIEAEQKAEVPTATNSRTSISQEAPEDGRRIQSP